MPGFQDIMLPLMQLVSDGKEHSIREAIDKLADEPFKLSEEEKRELLPSGKQAIFDNRVGWCRTYLKKAGLLESKRRAHFNITDKGFEVLSQNPTRIDVKFLKQYPEFVEFHTAKPDDTESPKKGEEEQKTPEEILEENYQEIRKTVAQDLIKTVKGSSPTFFENLVLDLLLAMGYGGSRKDAGEATRRSVDGGIDGIIKEDKLGLDVIYIQAKKWDKNNIRRPEIQQFIGVLQENRARKGVFLTTSDFSKGARESVQKVDSKIILINGELLAELMIDYNIGVSKTNTYEIKKIDFDYFIEE